MSSTLKRLLLPVSLVVAIIAQWFLLNASDISVGIALYLVAIALLLIAAPRDAAESAKADLVPSLQRFQSPHSTRRFLALAACIICALGAFTLNADASFGIREGLEYQFTFVGVAAWIASIILFLIAFWIPEKKITGWRNSFHLPRFCWNLKTIALLGVFILGAFFYFYNLNGVPAEMTSDHAEKLLDINDILTGHYPVFFVRNTGREPMQFYVTVVLMKLLNLPLSHLALKVGTALIGWLTIPTTCLLAREMFDDTVGILSAFFVATMHWAAAIARMGLRYPYTPFFAALALYFVWRALKYQRRNDFLVAGLVMGLGLYGYIPSRNIPLVAMGLFALWAIFEGWHCKIDWKQFTKNIALMLSGILVVFMPLLRYTLDFPEMFWYRALTRLSGAEQPIHGSVFSVFTTNLKNLALMFNWRGDPVWVTNIPDQPTLDWVSAGLIVLGVVIAIYWMIRGRKATYLYLLAAFVAFLLPSALALAFPNENPSLVRTGGAIPLAAILLALPLTALVRSMREHVSKLESTFRWMLVGAICVTIIALNYQWYFGDYDTTYRHFAQNSSEVAAVIRDFVDHGGDLQHAYFIGYPYWIDGRAIAINLGDINWRNFSLDATDWVNNEDTRRFYILYPDDMTSLEILQTEFPHGELERHISRTPGKDFLSFLVPAN